ncbi:hypothetical protein [Streptomyces mordarskii]|uniref:Uncharacterized protein n=1 Tax=Streptomyces mordarskii TaxID=1226758 RepID=A0ABP3PTA5_9ACTN
MTHPAQTKPVTARRLTTRALRQIIRFSDPAATATIAVMAILWISHTGPAWIATADDWTIVTYGIGIAAARVVLDVIAEWLIDLADPDRWDGDIAYAIAEDLRQLRTDITMGADPDEVLDSLSTSNLVPELLETLRGLSTQYAALGDEDEKQRLLAAVLHLRHADQNIGYGPDQIAALHAATADQTSLR